MAANQLVVDGARDGRKIEPAPLLCHTGVEDDLEQQVAELVSELVRATVLDGVGDLVGLLDGVRGDAGEGLLAIPGTTALRVAQPCHERDERGNGPLGVRHEAPADMRYSVSNIPAVAPQMLRSPKGMS